MFEEILKELRLNRGLNQVQLAEELFVTKQTVSNWENGYLMPSVDLLMRIAKYFSVSTDYLLGLDDRRYLETTGLTDKQITHIQMIIDDILGDKGEK
ncbi:MAG: helix-turn-helix transcriptional regulator [Clostridia bacterium]|jgi:transcriptional regulator with XRE-family HTH domain|nr:helix-turn-helix transcriptional regulator [Clostridia bacterium]